jgi:hypothetical protein
MSVLSQHMDLPGSGGNLLVMASLSILFRLFRILVELTGISNSSLDRRHIWSIDVLLSQTLPGNLGEPGMVLDIF